MLLLQTLVTAMDDIFYGIGPTRIMYSLTAFLECIGVSTRAQGLGRCLIFI